MSKYYRIICLKVYLNCNINCIDIREKMTYNIK